MESLPAYLIGGQTSIEYVRTENPLVRIRTIHQLEDYLTGKFEQELKIVFNAMT